MVIMWLIMVIIWLLLWLMMVNNNLVGGIPTPLKNMTSSVGMMKFPIYGKIDGKIMKRPCFVGIFPEI